MSYVNGFLLAVPDDKKEDYRSLAQKAAAVFKRCGALSVVECWEADVPDGELTSFPLAVKRMKGESIVFSWVRWPSKAVHDDGMKVFMEDPICDPNTNPMPFDGKRMIYGGFEVLVDE